MEQHDYFWMFMDTIRWSIIGAIAFAILIASS